MSDYRTNEVYILRQQVPYRPECWFYPVGNSTKPADRRANPVYGPAGSRPPPQLMPGSARAPGNSLWELDPTRTDALAPRAPANIWDLECAGAPAPMRFMELMPFDPSTGKFSDCAFYKNHKFAPGSN